MPLCASAVDRPHITVFNRRDRGHGQCLVVRSTRSLATATWPRPGACSTLAPRWGIERTFALHRGCHSGHSSTACIPLARNFHRCSAASLGRAESIVRPTAQRSKTDLCCSFNPGRLLVVELQRCKSNSGPVSLLYRLVLRSRHRSNTAPPSFSLARDRVEQRRPNHRPPFLSLTPKSHDAASYTPQSTSPSGLT